MRFKCGLTVAERKARYERLTNWHRWFAWHPVSIVPGDCRWLEWVERKGEYSYGGMGDDWWNWEYRA